MPDKREELLENVAQLKAQCRSPIGEPATFERICALAKSIAGSSADSAVSSVMMDVLFRADDLFRRPHLQSEAVLRQILDDRLYRLEATVRASSGTPLIGIERRRAGSAQPDLVGGRRWSDRLAAFAIAL